MFTTVSDSSTNIFKQVELLLNNEEYFASIVFWAVNV